MTVKNNIVECLKHEVDVLQSLHSKKMRIANRLDLETKDVNWFEMLCVVNRKLNYSDLMRLFKWLEDTVFNNDKNSRHREIYDKLNIMTMSKNRYWNCDVEKFSGITDIVYESGISNDDFELLCERMIEEHFKNPELDIDEVFEKTFRTMGVIN
jgi:hypothetical protein